MSKLKQRFINFMQGRYGGNDSLNKWLLGAFIVLLLLSILLQSSILDFLSILVLIYSYFRIFSKNISKRSAENQKFLEIKQKVISFFRGKKFAAIDRTHHIYRCPNCKQKVRVPKGRGKICITCPKCQTKFIKRS